MENLSLLPNKTIRSASTRETTDMPVQSRGNSPCWKHDCSSSDIPDNLFHLSIKLIVGQRMSRQGKLVDNCRTENKTVSRSVSSERVFWPAQLQDRAIELWRLEVKRRDCCRGERRWMTAARSSRHGTSLCWVAIDAFDVQDVFFHRYLFIYLRTTDSFLVYLW